MVKTTRAARPLRQAMAGNAAHGGSWLEVAGEASVGIYAEVHLWSHICVTTGAAQLGATAGAAQVHTVVEVVGLSDVQSLGKLVSGMAVTLQASFVFDLGHRLVGLGAGESDDQLGDAAHLGLEVAAQARLVVAVGTAYLGLGVAGLVAK